MEPLVVILVTVLFVAVAVGAFLLGGRNDTRLTGAAESQRLDEYHFYPFTVDETGHVGFDADLFTEAVGHLLVTDNARAARELIVIGEQNLVRDTFPSTSLAEYKLLYEKYDGDDVMTDNEAYLENYRRLVNQLGRSFPHTGIEILLHNLVNPAKALVWIENGEVTGRSVGSGATNLVLDLKTRRQRGEGKVNYELNIGSRQFKCTTVPIFRSDYGLVGAVCVNIDANFIRDAAYGERDRLEAFIDNLLRTDFELGENILSKDEYQLAMRGKRHFMDEAIRMSGSPRSQRRLAAIMFSDIVGFSALMETNESETLSVLEANDVIHLDAFARHGGRMLKKLGDGLLSSFATASGAVECAEDIAAAVAEDGRFQVRIGIHLGEIIESEGDVYGDGVNISSRIQQLLQPGQIGFSKVVYDNIKNKSGFTSTLLGEYELKNHDEPVSLYLLNTVPAQDQS